MRDHVNDIRLASLLIDEDDELACDGSDSDGYIVVGSGITAAQITVPLGNYQVATSGSPA